MCITSGAVPASAEGADMTEPRRRRLPWILGSVVGACAALAAVSCAASPSGPPPAAADSSTTTSITAQAAPSTTIEDVQAQVDQAVAADGVPFDYATTIYPDAYAAIVGECQAWASTGSNVAGLLRGRVAAGYIQLGEIRALQVGVPLACPQYAAAVSAALGNG